MVAKIVEKTMPSRMAPFHLRASMMIVTTRPKIVTPTGTPTQSPSVTGVPLPATTRPPSTRPMKRMKKPMPMAIAFLSCSGMALKMASRKPVSTRMVMTMPSIRMMPMAPFMVRPPAATRLKATTALRPMPGARAYARFVYRPMIRVITPATRQVDVSTAANGRPFDSRSLMPTKPRITGFTKMM